MPVVDPTSADRPQRAAGSPGTSPWRMVAAGAAAVSVLATGALVARALSAPGPAAGSTLADARSTASPSPSPTPSATAPTLTTPPLPRPTARDASLGALRTAAVPAPVRVVIPDLDVRARVDPVGVQRDGAMVIPAAPTSVGWYRYGPAPASPEGNTVVAGHVATREDGPGAFAPLRGAEPGMRVEVTDAAGTVHRYEVVGRERIVKQALPVDEIFARDGEPLLVLVTCGGEYLPELRSHRDNVVVTARPVG